MIAGDFTNIIDLHMGVGLVMGVVMGGVIGVFMGRGEPCPYDLAEYWLAVVGANGDKIGAGLRVIVSLQTDGPAVVIGVYGHVAISAICRYGCTTTQACYV